MASINHFLHLTVLSVLLFFPNPTFSAEVPESSPSPSPQLPPQAISSPPTTAPAPSLAFPDSPPAPPPSRLATDSPSPAPSPAEDDGASPSPAPDVAADAGQSHLGDGDLDRRGDSDGMSGGKKAGIAIGVIAAGFLVALAAMVYKKRQYNIRRRQYSYTDRRDFM